MLFSLIFCSGPGVFHRIINIVFPHNSTHNIPSWQHEHVNEIIIIKKFFNTVYLMNNKHVSYDKRPFQDGVRFTQACFRFLYLFFGPRKTAVSDREYKSRTSGSPPTATTYIRLESGLTKRKHFKTYFSSGKAS